MPDITELLRDAAPTVRPFDESDVRRRVGERRRRRWSLAVGALVALAGFGVAASVLAGDSAEQAVITNEPAAAATTTALALVHGDVWIGGDGFVQREDGSMRIEVSGPVRQLAVGDLLWAAGDSWVDAIDPETGTWVGTWGVDGIGGLQPLPDRRVAVSVPGGGRVLVLRYGTTIAVDQSIEVPGVPSDLVLTIGDQLWVNDGEVICRIDFDEGTAPDTQSWSGRLLAPSRSGGIWTMEGERIVDLQPEDLSVGVSVATAERFQVTAEMAVETAAGLYVGGPAGVSRHDAEGGEIVDIAVPDAIAGDDQGVVYLVDGEVRRAHAEDPQVAQVHEESERLSRLIAAREADQRFVRTVLGWVDVTMGEGITSDDGTDFVQSATSPSLGQTVELHHDVVDGWRLTRFSTFIDQDVGRGFALGTGNDSVTVAFDDPVLTPTLQVTYGANVATRLGERGGPATWAGDIGFVPDTPGTVWVLWRNDDGVVVEAEGFSVPAGPVAAG